MFHETKQILIVKGSKLAICSWQGAETFKFKRTVFFIFKKLLFWIIILVVFFPFICFFGGQVLVEALVVGIMHVPRHACGGQRATHRSHSSTFILSILVGPRARAQVMGFGGHVPVTSEPTCWSLTFFETVSCNLEFLMSSPLPPKPWTTHAQSISNLPN